MSDENPGIQDASRTALGTFAKGHSGNPHGRKQGPSLSTQMRQRIKDGDLDDILDFLKRICKGEVEGENAVGAIKLLWDRTDGAVIHKVEAEVDMSERRVVAVDMADIEVIEEKEPD